VNRKTSSILSSEEINNRFVIASGSMFPALKKGDIVVVERADRVKRGDVAVFYDHDMLISHRVVTVSDFLIKTKGDALDYYDQPVPLRDVVGIVSDARSDKTLFKTQLKSMIRRRFAVFVKIYRFFVKNLKN